MKDAERYFLRLRRLNQGMDTGNLRVYEHMEEPNGARLAHSMDTTSVAALEGMDRKPFRGMG